MDGLSGAAGRITEVIDESWGVKRREDITGVRCAVAVPFQPYD